MKILRVKNRAYGREKTLQVRENTVKTVKTKIEFLIHLVQERR